MAVIPPLRRYDDGDASGEDRPLAPARPCLSAAVGIDNVVGDNHSWHLFSFPG
jgi:hypothetical protein